MKWTLCKAAPAVSDVVRWIEPIWAAPTKKRGKPDDVGVQQLTAEVVEAGHAGFQLRVLSVEIISQKGDVVLKVKSGDTIRRKRDTLERGDCRKQG